MGFAMKSTIQLLGYLYFRKPQLGLPRYQHSPKNNPRDFHRVSSGLANMQRWARAWTMGLCEQNRKITRTDVTNHIEMVGFVGTSFFEALEEKTMSSFSEPFQPRWIPARSSWDYKKDNRLPVGVPLWIQPRDSCVCSSRQVLLKNTRVIRPRNNDYLVLKWSSLRYFFWNCVLLSSRLTVCVFATEWTSSFNGLFRGKVHFHGFYTQGIFCRWSQMIVGHHEQTNIDIIPAFRNTIDFKPWWFILSLSAMWLSMEIPIDDEGVLNTWEKGLVNIIWARSPIFS